MYVYTYIYIYIHVCVYNTYYVHMLYVFRLAVASAPAVGK